MAMSDDEEELAAINAFEEAQRAHIKPMLEAVIASLSEQRRAAADGRVNAAVRDFQLGRGTYTQLKAALAEHRAGLPEVRALKDAIEAASARVSDLGSDDGEGLPVEAGPQEISESGSAGDFRP
jgi:hypothetical protein